MGTTKFELNVVKWLQLYKKINLISINQTVPLYPWSEVWVWVGARDAFVHLKRLYIVFSKDCSSFSQALHVCEIFEMIAIAIQFDIMKLGEKFKRSMHQGKILVEHKTWKKIGRIFSESPIYDLVIQAPFWLIQHMIEMSEYTRRLG